MMRSRAPGVFAARLSTLLAVLALALAGCATVPRAPPAPMTTPGAAAAAIRDPRAAIVGSATAMLGQRYRYGGAAPGGFDCSGLVEYAASSAGIYVPRTAQAQIHAGVPVPRDELRPGDLVFMHLARKELHVGIAIDRDRFVHAPSTGGRVRIDFLAAHPYARGFVQARRIVADAARSTP